MRLSPSHRHSRVTPGNATAILKTFWRGVRSGRPGIKVATAVGGSQLQGFTRGGDAVKE